MILEGGNYTVYKHTSPIGKVYIGITKMNPIRRWSNGKGYKRCTHFYNAIIKKVSIKDSDGSTYKEYRLDLKSKA